MTKTHKGQCRCGGVRIEATGAPGFMGYCHCDDYRRSNGSPVSAFVGFRPIDVKWLTKETLSKWRNGNYVRHFCKVCGAPVAYVDENAPEMIFFYSGFMVEPANFPPEHHSYHGEHIPWLILNDTLERFENTPYPRAE